uniref:Glucan endo-1,3-beta-D-glucosidase n=1 Tax=Chenopodium quinoa TaxID=63459 RepID=A0A803MJL0_CHEQI
MAVTAMLLLVMVYLFLNVHHTDNLLSEQDVINLYKSNGIGTMRLFNPNIAALQALQGSGIKTIVGVANGDLPFIASDPTAATQWVQTNVVPFATVVKYIAVAIDTSLLTNTYPRSASEFGNAGYITPIINFLTSMVRLCCGRDYQNLFDAIVDGVYVALGKARAPNAGIVVLETRESQFLVSHNGILENNVMFFTGGDRKPWPSEGGDDATVENAGTYYRNLIGHVKQARN